MKIMTRRNFKHGCKKSLLDDVTSPFTILQWLPIYSRYLVDLQHLPTLQLARLPPLATTFWADFLQFCYDDIPEFPSTSCAHSCQSSFILSLPLLRSLTTTCHYEFVTSSLVRDDRAKRSSFKSARPHLTPSSCFTIFFFSLIFTHFWKGRARGAQLRRAGVPSQGLPSPLSFFPVLTAAHSPGCGAALPAPCDSPVVLKSRAGIYPPRDSWQR